MISQFLKLSSMGCLARRGRRSRANFSKPCLRRVSTDTLHTQLHREENSSLLLDSFPRLFPAAHQELSQFQWSLSPALYSKVHVLFRKRRKQCSQRCLFQISAINKNKACCFSFWSAGSWTDRIHLVSFSAEITTWANGSVLWKLQPPLMVQAVNNKEFPVS